MLNLALERDNHGETNVAVTGTEEGIISGPRIEDDEPTVAR